MMDAMNAEELTDLLERTDELARRAPETPPAGLDPWIASCAAGARAWIFG